MDALKDTSDDLQQESSNSDADENVKLIVDKQISANDIRARILRLPKSIINLLSADVQKVKVVFDGLAPKDLTIAKNRAYLAGVTEVYLLSEEEIKIFFEECDRFVLRHKAKGRPYVLPALYRFLYCCGVRCREARNLKCTEVHLNEG